MVNARLLGRRVSQPLLSMDRMMAVPSRPARCGRRSVQSRQPRTLGPEPGLRSVMRDLTETAVQDAITTESYGNSGLNFKCGYGHGRRPTEVRICR